MIASFRHKGLKRFFSNDDRSKLPPDMVERIEVILGLLDNAADPDALNLPTMRLHQLQGSLREHWSVTVRANWRITFVFRDGNAYDVDFLDYH